MGPFKHWQARYNKILLDVYETPGPHIYLATSTVRRVLPKLRNDAALAREHGRSVGSVSKDDDSLYFNEAALRKELRIMGAPEALMFAEWLHLHLYCPAAKKRGEDVRPHRMAASEQAPVVRPAPAPKTWKDRQEKVSLVQWTLLPLTTHWRGTKTPKKTFIESTILATLMVWLATMAIQYVCNPDNYFGGWELYKLKTLVLFLALSGAWVWWGVGVVRFALRHLHKGSGIASTFSVFLVGLGLILYSSATAVESARDWVLGLFDPIDVADVRIDKATNRIVFKGDVGFGSYRRLQQAITDNPRANLLELDSPGGYVIEGLAMARLIKQSGLDTVTFRYCDSACTLLLAAGKKRYLGPKASVGFHRSSVFGKPVGEGWTHTEFLMARYLERQGVDKDFIDIAFSYPGDDLWLPKHGYMLDAKYVTARWGEQ